MVRKRKQQNTRGCTWMPARKKWMVRIQMEGNNKFLGYFDTLTEARAVYLKEVALFYAEHAKEAAWESLTEKQLKR